MVHTGLKMDPTGLQMDTNDPYKHSDICESDSGVYRVPDSTIFTKLNELYSTEIVDAFKSKSNFCHPNSSHLCIFSLCVKLFLETF